MGMMGEMAREGFKKEVLRVIDGEISPYVVRTQRSDSNVDIAVELALRKLREKIEKLDTA